MTTTARPTAIHHLFCRPCWDFTPHEVRAGLSNQHFYCVHCCTPAREDEGFGNPIVSNEYGQVVVA